MIDDFYRLEVLPRLKPELVFEGLDFKCRGRRDWRARCPLHQGDNPEAFSVNPETLLWHCFTACGRGGDAIDYVIASCGLDFRGAVKHLAELAGVSQRLAEGWSVHSVPWRNRATIQRMSPACPKRHPREEIAAFWNSCRPVTEDAEVCAYLKKRCLSPATVEERDVARAVPAIGELPWWARYCGQAWNTARQKFRLVVKLFGATGQLESVHARALYPQDSKGRDKAAAVAGASLKGLVMAEELGRLLLTVSSVGDGRPAVELVRRCGLWIAEGSPDFCTLAAEWSDADEDAPAVLGILSGTWTEELALRIPDGCEVIIATHNDPAGDRYAAGILATLEQRRRANLIKVRRWKPRKAA